MYDRTVRPIPEAEMTGFRHRIETLIGMTGWKMAKYRMSWKNAILSPLDVVWRPHLMMALLFEVSCTRDSRTWGPAFIPSSGDVIRFWNWNQCNVLRCDRYIYGR